MNSKPRHIVIVEDDQEMRELLRDFLTHDGYNVSPYSTAHSALSSLKSTIDGVDLVITDVVMEKMPGTELIKEVKRLRSGLPVIVISAFGGGNRKIEVESISNGAYHFIHKPFSLQEFRKIVKDAIQTGN